MPTTPLPETSTAARNGHPRLPDSVVLERVRTAFLKADSKRSKRPGRPTLIRNTGGTDYQVRRAMRTLDAEIAHTQPLATQASPPHRHNGTQPETSSPPSAPPQERPHLPHDDQPPADGAEPASHHAPGASAHQLPSPPSAWPLGFIGAAAAVAVWGGWVDLRRFTGFGLVQPLPGLVDDLWINTAIVLPIGIEAYGGYALRTWLSSAALSTRTRSYARWSALASLVVGGAAQVASHLMKAHGITVAPWWVTVVVSCVPVAVLGLATGLATLVRQDTTGISTGISTTSSPTRTSKPYFDENTEAPPEDDQRSVRRPRDWWPKFTRRLLRR